MSALPPIADIRRCTWDVREVPKADIGAALFDYRHSKSKRAPPCEDARLVNNLGLIARVPAAGLKLIHYLGEVVTLRGLHWRELLERLEPLKP